jgi:hypothetical protein
MTNLNKLMNYLFGNRGKYGSGWDYDSPAYRYWSRYIKKQKTSLKNLKRRAKKIIEKE